MGAEIETCRCENCGADDQWKEHVGKLKCYYCKTTNMCPRCVASRPGAAMCFACSRKIFK